MVTNLGTGGSALDAQSGSTSGADTNDPLHLAHAGTNYVYLPGVNGNYLSVPDSAALDITGDIDLRVKVALDDWVPASETYLLSKYAGGQASFFLCLAAVSGALKIVWSPDGSSLIGLASTVSPTVSDGDQLWVRATLDVDNGAGGRDAKFYTSPDGSSWTQLGATVTEALGATSIYSGSSPVEIGSVAGGTSAVAAGKFYRAQVYSGIGGTLVLDVDTSVITSGSATSFTATTGQTVTINRATSGRKAVAVTAPVWLLGTDDYFEVADNALLDFGASDSFTVLAVVRQWHDSPATQVLLAKTTSGASTAPGWRLYTYNGTPYCDVSDGAVGPYASKAAALGASNVVMFERNVATDKLTVRVNGTAGAEATDTTTGTLATSDEMRVGRFSGAGTSYADMEFLAAAVWRRVLTDAEIALVTSYFQSRWP